ncbi:hypothetical protein RS75_13215 [Rhizobium nepotum 39/7]|uniref:Uncharacterized protein n=2 Tax=Rhizobium nepotum TaxID=1035271 RepID=A0ABR5CRH6_9HYPH|nr:hypothetical protein RS75_13215 [Rhizobium nepotum 39/7]
MRTDLSNPPAAADIVDAEIRNAIEGFASELELADRAEAAANDWYEETYRNIEAGHDVHFRAGQIAAFVSGSLSMARDLGHLPEGGAA